MCPSVSQSVCLVFFVFFLEGGEAFCFSVSTKKGFGVSRVYVVVCINMNNFMFVQAYIFACAQLSGWPSVCVSVHESWARVKSAYKFEFF